MCFVAPPAVGARGQHRARSRWRSPGGFGLLCFVGGGGGYIDTHWGNIEVIFGLHWDNGR